MSAEAECMCGWRKEYVNGFAAGFGLEAHWQHQCPLTVRGHGAKSGSNEGLTDHSTPDLYGTWPRSQSIVRSGTHA